MPLINTYPSTHPHPPSSTITSLVFLAALAAGSWAGLAMPNGSADLEDWDLSTMKSLNPFVNAYGHMRSPWNNNPSQVAAGVIVVVVVVVAVAVPAKALVLVPAASLLLIHEPYHAMPPQIVIIL